ncbi:anaphase-promoting complex subunit 2-like [Ctenocephalides felis]|uniref:anaphase-promoting complex subunit 2-like n=1 Tax=Ctenocephalides felis TaxID=7515 RepID=UPI000E6E3FEB|nr:anaphase-promoting complex subunit 2-like [Ctenocephalides felis]
MTDKLWKTFCAAFPILNEKRSPESITEDNFINSVQELRNLKIDQIFIQHIFTQIETYIRQQVAPLFWSKFQIQNNAQNTSNNFQDSVTYLYDFVKSFQPQLQRLDYMRKSCDSVQLIYGESDTLEAFLVILRATLFSQKVLDYEVVVHDFYDKAFKVFANCDTDAEDSLDDITCPGCSMETDSCACSTIVMNFHYVNSCLMSMGLLEKLAGQVITSLIQDRINLHVKNTTKGSFDLSHIKPLEEWLDCIVVNWLIKIYCGGSAEIPRNNLKIAKAIERFKRKLGHFLYETYTLTRIEQLFNIIIEYPESQPAIEDLKQCLPKTELRPKLVSTLQNALQTRLLHPGANTPDILTAYISAIKALRHLDPSGVLLETITEPVRQYLRGRDDTIR